MSPRMGDDGDLFVQVLTPGKAFELNRYSHPDSKTLVLSTAEVRWLLTTGLPAVLAEGAPLLSPAQVADARRLAAGRARTSAAPPDVPPAEQPPETVPPAAPAGAVGPSSPERGPGVGYTIRPASDDEDAPPPAGGTEGGASSTLTLDGMDVGA